MTTYQKDRPTPLHAGRLANIIYVLKGRGRTTVDRQTFESGPRDAFAQPGGKPHQTVALSNDYEQFSAVGIVTPPEGEGLKVNEEDLAQGNLIPQKDAPRQQFSF